MAGKMTSFVTRLLPSPRYDLLKEQADDGHLSIDSHNETNPVSRKSEVRARTCRLFMTCCVPIATFLAGLFWPHNLDRICFYHTSMRCKPAVSYEKVDYNQLTIWDKAPIALDMDISYHEEVFDNAFKKPTIYRMDPSPEVDAAWDNLGFTWENATFSPEQWADAEMPMDAVRVPEDYGPDYFGEIKGFHDLHCLNLLRKALYFNIDYYKSTPDVWEFQDDDQVIKTHIGHCLDSLRLQLTCTPSLDVLPWVWVDSRDWIEEKEREPSIIANFKTRHMCRDFGAIKDWYAQQQDARLKSGELGPWRPRSDDVIYDGKEFP